MNEYMAKLLWIYEVRLAERYIERRYELAWENFANNPKRKRSS